MSEYITSEGEMIVKQRNGNLSKESFVACYDVIYSHSSPCTENKHEKHRNENSSYRNLNGTFYEHDLEMLLLEAVGLLIHRVMQNSFDTRCSKKW